MECDLEPAKTRLLAVLPVNPGTAATLSHFSSFTSYRLHTFEPLVLAGIGGLSLDMSSLRRSACVVCLLTHTVTIEFPLRAGLANAQTRALHPLKLACPSLLAVSRSKSPEPVDGSESPTQQRTPVMSPLHAKSIRNHFAFLGFAAFLTVTAVTAQVATGTTGIDTSGNYDEEVRACLQGKTQQDQATCMTEARNAQADRKSGKLGDNSASLKANAASRCDSLAGEDKAACEARVQGRGTTSGSVAGGGVLREVETVVMPAGASSVLIEPRTSDPVVLPSNSR